MYVICVHPPTHVLSIINQLNKKKNDDDDDGDEKRKTKRKYFPCNPINLWWKKKKNKKTL